MRRRKIQVFLNKLNVPGVVLQSEKYYEVGYFLLRMRMRLHRDRLPNYNTTRALQHDHYYRLTRCTNCMLPPF